MKQKRVVLLIVFSLTLLTYGAFRNALQCGFITAYDDAIYITENTHIASGISSENLLWALTALYASNWHPLTWVSHMLDIDLFGLDPAGHHISSLFFHISNTILLFLIFSRSTGSVWKSALVALLFSVHPTRVESVVWVAERKDVLSTFFAFLTIHSYISYSKKRVTGRYVLALLLFSCALASKPMVVTLPAILLLMDLWPLNRFRPELKTRAAVLEKLPFFALSFFTGIFTVFAQKSSGALELSAGLSLSDRLSHAFSSYLNYLFLLFWPFRLSAYYPFPEEISILTGLFSLLLLSGITWVFINSYESRKYLIVGWAWFLVTLFPVIGLLQAGAQGMADRYTYFPSIGLFLIVVFGGGDLLKTRPGMKPFFLTGACVTAMLFFFLTLIQVPFWKDSITLFERAVQVTRRNIHGHHNLGVAYSAAGRIDDSISQYKRVLKIRPGDTLAHHNLGLSYMKKNRVSLAVHHFREALKSDPGQMLTRYNLALGLIQMNDLPAAVTQLKRAVDLKPGFKYAWFKLGTVEQRRGNYSQAKNYLLKAIQIDPDFSDARVNLGNILEDIYSDTDGAYSHYKAALAASPEFAEAHNSLGILLAKKGNLLEARRHFDMALRLKPGYEDARRNLSRIIGEEGVAK